MKLSGISLFIFLMCLRFQNGMGQSPAIQADSLGPFILRNIDTWSIHSATIDEDYTLYVLRTAAYDTSNIRLPVLYMTDGDWNMTVSMICFSSLRQDYRTKEPLIVGIGYGKGKNQRMRDLDPATGGPAFLTFIEKEVMPFINSRYRTSDEKAIYGYSMGGMFTTWVLFHRSDLFNIVFIGAPANNGGQLLPEAKKYFTDHKDLKSKVFIGVGSYERQTAARIDSFTDYLAAQKCPDLIIKKEFTPGAGHGAALFPVMENAIAFGYCQKHEVVKVDPAILSQYSGTYVSENKSIPEVVVFTEKNKLFWKFVNSPESAPELLPCGKTEFFMPENELIQFTFKKQTKGMTLVVNVPQENMEYVLNRKE